jgi:hypothetical protein
MNKHYLAAAIVFFATISNVLGAEVRFGNIALPPNAQTWVPVLVTGGESVSGMDFAIQVGDGGLANGGSATKPAILDLDTTGPNTVFHSSNIGSDPQSSGGLMWADSVLTDLDGTAHVPASGILAWVMFDTAGTAVNDVYSVKLDHVSAADLTTAFVDSAVTTALVNGHIYIRGSETMTWNKLGDGLWRESHWSGSPQDYPNFITAVVVATPHTVAIDNPSPLPTVEWLQEAHSLTLGNGGNVTVDPRVALHLSAASQVGENSTLAVQGRLEAGDLTLSGGTLFIDDGGTANVSRILGTGDVRVGGEEGTAILNAISIEASTLTIGRVSASAASQNPSNSVPEPSSLILLTIAAFWLIRRAVSKI